MKKCKYEKECNEMSAYQRITEMLLNLAGRTAGEITTCEDCNLYWPEEDDYLEYLKGDQE